MCGLALSSSGGWPGIDFNGDSVCLFHFVLTCGIPDCQKARIEEFIVTWFYWILLVYSIQLDSLVVCIKTFLNFYNELLNESLPYI